MVRKPYLKKNESLCRTASSEREKEQLQIIFHFFTWIKVQKLTQIREALPVAWWFSVASKLLSPPFLPAHHLCLLQTR